MKHGSFALSATLASVVLLSGALACTHDSKVDSNVESGAAASNEVESSSDSKVDNIESGAVASGAAASNEVESSSETARKTEVFPMSDTEWREKLTPEQYYVLREKGTERAFTGKYWDEKTPGVYKCAGCGQELFDAGTKFDSGTGWPSFYQPIADGKVAEEADPGIFGTRTEVLCSRCGGHLGHVFDDGPRPTGQRYCINSVSLELDPVSEGETKEERAVDPE